MCGWKKSNVLYQSENSITWMHSSFSRKSSNASDTFCHSLIVICFLCIIRLLLKREWNYYNPKSEKNIFSINVAFLFPLITGNMEGYSKILWITVTDIFDQTFDHKQALIPQLTITCTTIISLRIWLMQELVLCS